MLESIRLSNVDIRPKIVLAFVLVALFAGIAGGVGYLGVGAVGDGAAEISEEAEQLDAASEILYATSEKQEAILLSQLGDDDARALYDGADELYAEEGVSVLESHSLIAEEAALFGDIQSTHDEFDTVATELFDAQEAGNEELAEQKAAEAFALSEQLESTSREFEEVVEADLEATAAAAAQTTQTAQIAAAAITVLAFISAIVVGLFVAGRISKPINQLADAATAASEGDLSADVDEHIENDEIGRMIDAFSGMQADLQAIFGDLETVSQGLARGNIQTDVDTAYPGTYGQLMGDIDEATDQLDNSFTEIQRASESISEKNLDIDIQTDSPGRYGSVLVALDSAAMELNGTVKRIEGIADTVVDASQESASTAEAIDDASDEVAASVEEIQQASTEVANSVEEISSGAEQQSDDLQTVAGEMNDMSATVEEIASSAEEVAVTASTAVERSQEGQQYASEATDEIDAIETEAETAAAQVEALDEKMAEISEVVDLITDIAEQTNLLALNASIEAARAGEAGEGFAVVADEIKGLAEEVGEATTDIETQIADIQSTTEQTVEGMDEMADRVDRGSETIEEAISMFDEIAGAVGEAESGIEEISTATDDQAASSEEVVSMVDEVTTVSEQTASDAGTVSAATEEQTSSLSEVAGTAEELSQLADSSTAEQLSALSAELHEQVEQFELSDETAAATANEITAATGPTATGQQPAAHTDGGQRPDGRPSGQQ